MLKNRLIFTLLYNKGKYMLSRNFALQSVGDINWLRDFYDCDSIAYSIDELIVLNVARSERDVSSFCHDLKEMSKNYFMPIAAGGGIRSISDAQMIMNSGADKLVINTALFCDANLVKDLIKIYGSQCIVASVDYKKVGSEKLVFIENGQVNLGISVAEAVKSLEDLCVGEIYLNSISDDGAGEGYDIPTIKEVASKTSIPVIASGGAGRFDHFVTAYKECGVKAAATADLFNFMSDSLSDARSHIIESSIPMANWNPERVKLLRNCAN